MDAKAGEYRRSELPGLDVTISARYHWSVARQLTPFLLRHRNLRNLTLQQECYLTNTRAFPPTHGSIMMPPRQPCVFARLARWQIFTNSSDMTCLPLCALFNFQICGTFPPVFMNIFLRSRLTLYKYSVGAFIQRSR